MFELNRIGPLVFAGLDVFLTASVALTLFPKWFHRIVVLGIILLSCVFIEPSPSDLILAGAIPLGLLTRTYKPEIRGYAVGTLLILAAYNLVSLPAIATAVDQNYALRYYAITFFLFLIATFIATYATKDNINSLIQAYVIGAFFSFLAGLAGYLGIFQEWLMADQFRVKGMFKDPNVFGPFFIPAILFLLEDSRKRAIFKIPSWVHWLLIACMTLGVIFSFSRAAWLNLIASLMVYFLLNLRKFRVQTLLRLLTVSLLLLAILIGVLLSPFMADTGIAEFLLERAKIQKYDSERFGAHHGGMILLQKNPFGYGPGQFVHVIADETAFEIDAHSLYVRTAVENGVVGFLLFFGGLGFMLLVLLLQHYRGQSEERTRVSPAVILAALTGLLVNSLVVDTMHWRHFWFLIGIGIYAMQENHTRKSC